MLQCMSPHLLQLRESLTSHRVANYSLTIASSLNSMIPIELSSDVKEMNYQTGTQYPIFPSSGATTTDLRRTGEKGALKYSSVQAWTIYCGKVCSIGQLLQLTQVPSSIQY